MANIENIIGYPLPGWVFNQLQERSRLSAKVNRNSSDLVYIANRTGWVRVVSSIIGIDNKAENYVLFGGTSAYKTGGGYTLRKGLTNSYAMGGQAETSNYGYKPFPGITSAKIVTQGKLGTNRMATINFKLNDFYQLEIIDSLYFKLGYSIIIEWGNTFFYNNGVLLKGEDFSIDPFASGATKDSLLKEISAKNQASAGNYDAMFGVITNYNFSYTKDGSYDCTINALGLGHLAESIKLNVASTYPGFLEKQIRISGDIGRAYQSSTNLAVGTGNAGVPVAAGTGGESPITTIEDPTYDGTSAEQNTRKDYYRSYLEAMLKAIQLYCYSKVTPIIQAKGTTSYQQAVWTFSMYKEDMKFLKEIFANGNISDSFSGASGALAYGYARSYMESTDPTSLVGLEPINFGLIMRAYMVNYKKEGNLSGVSSNLPTYIPLSFLFMMINNGGLLYDKDKNSPIIYLDFNNETNLCLTNTKTFSIDPINFLTPFELSDVAYKNIFDKNIKIIDPATKKDVMFKRKQDAISGNLLPFRKPGPNYSFRGRFLNVLVNIDYLLGVMEKLANQNDYHAVIVQDFLNFVMSDLNKALGNFNFFRVAYSDKGNVLYVSDDQTIPGTGTISSGQGNFEIPKIGKTSIYEDFSMRTDASTRLGSSIAISANKDVVWQGSAGVDASPLSIGHGNAIDRFKKLVVAAGDGNQAGTSTGQTNEAAVQFNNYVSNIYGQEGIINTSDTFSMMNYYIDKMAKFKAGSSATNRAAIIPITLNFTIEGISGFTKLMGFKIPDSMLPKVYNGVGFIVVGEENTIQSNRWTTTIKGGMANLKNQGDYNTEATADQQSAPAEAGSNTFAGRDPSTQGTINSFSVTQPNTNYVAPPSPGTADARSRAEAYLGKNMSDQDFNNLMAAVSAEASNKSVEEQALIAAVIMNRAKQQNTTITNVLNAKNQFQSVTGPGSTANYINGPKLSTQNSIYNALSTLNSSMSNYQFFVSANQAAYTAGTDPLTISYIKNLQSTCSSCVTLVGGSYFTTK